MPTDTEKPTTSLLVETTWGTGPSLPASSTEAPFSYDRGDMERDLVEMQDFLYPLVVMEPAHYSVSRDSEGSQGTTSTTQLFQNPSWVHKS